MGPAAFISSSDLCDLMPGPLASFQWALAGLQRRYIHPPALKRKGKIEPTQRDHRIGKQFPRAILNLALYSAPVNRKQLIPNSGQWSPAPAPFPSPSPAPQGSLPLCRWLAGISSLLLSFILHVVLPSHTLQSPFFFSLRSKLPNLGGTRRGCGA